MLSELVSFLIDNLSLDTIDTLFSFYNRISLEAESAQEV